MRASSLLALRKSWTERCPLSFRSELPRASRRAIRSPIPSNLAMAVDPLDHARLVSPRLEEVLDRAMPAFLHREQAFEMFARVDQALGNDRAIVVDQHRIGQLADAVGLADLGAVDEIVERDAVTLSHVAMLPMI